MHDRSVARLGEDRRVLGEGPWRNRLVTAHSPYLLEHADQPVDWHPWGDEAFALARSLDRPVFLSIGYSACHYCHVMARESFSDPAIGARLNEWFVPIKVDREEHPGVDAVYLQALAELNGEAGWPASLFLDPDRRAFQGGTYYPPQYRYGVPAFRDVLEQVHKRWEEHREDAVGMAAGGIHDHIGGGFHRYSVDPDWAVPHFEKMLVDNALLARTYLLAWARTRDLAWLRVAGGVLEFMATELRRPDGHLRASLDADDPMGEGAFYTWTPDELGAALGRSARAFGRAWNVREGGDLPGGRSVLRQVRDDVPLSVFLTRLRRARSTRPRPNGDDKAVVAWNALGVRAFALAARLPRLFRDDAPDGALEDHAFTASALLELYQATGEARCLLACSEVAQAILARFRDPTTGSLLHVARDDTALPVARVGWLDHAEPAGAAVAVEVLQALEALGDTAIPRGTADAILATAPLDREPAVLVIDGPPEDEAVRAMVRAWHRAWRPCGVLALVDPDGPLPARFEDLHGKRGSSPRGWLCEGGACRPPVDDAAALAELISAV